MSEGMAKRLAEKHLPNKPFPMRGPNYEPVDLNRESRKACESAIREALLGVAEMLEAESRDEKYNQITVITYHTAAEKVREEANRG